MRTIDVAGRKIGPGQPCFVIAEAGSNHDRDLGRAKELIDVAADAGADAVKFQSYRADAIAARTTDPIATLEAGGTTTLHELYARTEMPADWLPILQAHAADAGVLFLSTPFDPHAVDELDALGVPLMKIASFELVDLPLLRHAARTGRPMVLSTGMATLGEIEEALAAVRGEGQEDIVLLHCGINYPAPFSSVNLAAMRTMAAAFGLPVGYSDHTLGSTVPVAAVALGANVIEKHFTISNDLSGPDHSFALEPDGLRAMVRAVRDAEAAIGSPIKGPAPDEAVHLRRGRRSLFAARAIAEGEVLALDMIAVLRPGIGVAPKHLENLIGRRTRRAIDAQEPITWDAL
jgi:sialic acid synthase SpsE